MAQDHSSPATQPSDGKTPPRRRVGPRRSQASTDAVLDAAYGELAEQGWRGFSVDRVAKSARASKQTIYRWWKTPACLAVESVLRRVPEGRSAQDARDRISAVVEPMLLMLRSGDGAHAWRGALLAAADDEAAGELFRGWFAERIKAPMRHVLAEMAIRGQVRRDWDMDMATELMLGPVWHRLIAMRGPVPENYARRLIDNVLRALAPEPGA